MTHFKHIKTVVLYILAAAGLVMLAFHFAEGTESHVILAVEGIVVVILCHVVTSLTLESAPHPPENLASDLEALKGVVNTMSAQLQELIDSPASTLLPLGGVRIIKEFSFGVDVLSMAKKGDVVYVSTTYLSDFSRHQKEFENALARGVKFKILVLDPDAATSIKLRSSQIKKPDLISADEYQQGILDFVQHLKRVRSSVKGAEADALQIKHQLSIPCTPKYMILRKNGELKRVINGYFLNCPSSLGPHILWEPGDVSGPLRSLQQHMIDDWNSSHHNED